MSTLRESWFMLTGLPYPVRGFVWPADGPQAPLFNRDDADWIIDQINKEFPIPAYEVKQHESGDPRYVTFEPTHAGLEEGYTWYGPRFFDDVPYWQLGNYQWPWVEVESPNEAMFHLELRPREDDSRYYGSGHTLIQALADLERNLIVGCGPEAAFHENPAFIGRDIVELEGLTEVGGLLSCYDFSDPEGAFEIHRIHRSPVKDPEQVDVLDVALRRLEVAVNDLKRTMESRQR